MSKVLWDKKRKKISKTRTEFVFCWLYTTGDRGWTEGIHLPICRVRLHWRKLSFFCEQWFTGDSSFFFFLPSVCGKQPIALPIAFFLCVFPWGPFWPTVGGQRYLVGAFSPCYLITPFGFHIYISPIASFYVIPQIILRFNYPSLYSVPLPPPLFHRRTNHIG